MNKVFVTLLHSSNVLSLVSSFDLTPLILDSKPQLNNDSLTESLNEIITKYFEYSYSRSILSSFLSKFFHSVQHGLTIFKQYIL